jgi:hypothetical protein
MRRANRWVTFDGDGEIIALIAEGPDEPPEVADEDASDLGESSDTPDEDLSGHGSVSTTHSHDHAAMGSQGDDDNHSHEHTHSNDGSHDHHSSASATAEQTALAESFATASGMSVDEALTLLTRSTDHEAQIRQQTERLQAFAALGEAQDWPEVILADGSKLRLPIRWGEKVEPSPENGFREDWYEVEALDLSALTADGEQVNLVSNPGGSWHAYLCVEGVMTDEEMPRELLPDSVVVPDLPVPMRFQIHDEGGHFGAVTVGPIETMDRTPIEGLNYIYATGTFTPDHHGQLAQMNAELQAQRFVSIDGRDVDVEVVSVQVGSQQVSGPMYDCDDGCDDIVQQWYRFSSITIGAATIVSRPALQQAVIAMADMPLPMAPLALERAQPSIIVVAADGSPSTLPPSEWFEDPGFHVGDPRLIRQPDGKYACPLTVTADGRVFGHACYWGQLHTAGLVDKRGKPVTPPRGATYAHYMTGERETATGTVAVGQITMGCGHADTSRPIGAAAAKAHYDGGYGAVQIADVRAGEDDFGVWMAGALKPFQSNDFPEGPTAEQVRHFRTQEISPDWRKIAGQLHMIALLAVPVGGFPVARESLVASANLAEIVDLHAVRAGLDRDGEIVALVAAGRVHRASPEDRIGQLERLVSVLWNDLDDRQRANALEALDSVPWSA